MTISLAVPKRRLAGSDDFTNEEKAVLASLRRSSGRTCASCAWYESRGKHRGCFLQGKYRKWLSPEEYRSGCFEFEPKKKS